MGSVWSKTDPVDLTNISLGTIHRDGSSWTYDIEKDVIRRNNIIIDLTKESPQTRTTLLLKLGEIQRNYKRFPTKN